MGQTKRKFNTRINEHIENIKLDSSRYSVITEQYNHNFDWKNVRIMDTESNYNKRFISKTLHITEQLNGINLKKDTEFLYDIYVYLLNLIANNNRNDSA